MRTLIAAVVPLVIAACPAFAETGQEAPGGAQSAAATDTVQTGRPGAPAIAAPTFDGRSVYVTQIGGGNRAAVRQGATRASAEAVQRGDGNVVEIAQQGTGAAYARTTQMGDANRAGVAQSGSGPSVLFLDQSGSANQANVNQATYGALYNGAVLAQSGTGNRMALSQDGSDNRAVLAQTGDDNAMSAVQNGTGNRLAWVQQGNGLSDFGIVQSGGQALSIIQTGGR